MREIPLDKGKVALVDAVDFARVDALHWWALQPRKGGIWYACARIGP